MTLKQFENYGPIKLETPIFMQNKQLYLTRVGCTVMSQKPFQKFLNKTLLRSNKLFPAIQRNNDKNVHVFLACPLRSQWPWQWGQRNTLFLLKGIYFGPEKSWLSLFWNDSYEMFISICNYFAFEFQAWISHGDEQIFPTDEGEASLTQQVWGSHFCYMVWITAIKLHETQFLCKAFCLGSILGQKYSPCTSPHSHILTTQSLLGHRHTAQTPQFGNSPDPGNTGLQACVSYRSSSLPWHKAHPSLAKNKSTNTVVVAAGS